jgi:DNA-binding response OmpR family regulator
MAVPLILLVSDDEARLDVLRRALLDEGYRVESAHSRGALAVAKRTQPSAILVEIAPPATAGKEVCLRLRADSATRAIPVVGVTDRPVEELTDIPVSDWLVVPFGPDEVHAVVARWTTPV